MKVCESVVVPCTSTQIEHRFKKGDHEGVVALWPAVMCSDCVPGGAALSQVIESMQQLGVQVQIIAGDIRRALKQNTGFAEDIEGLCQMVDDLRRRSCVDLLEAFLAVFEELEPDLALSEVLTNTESALRSLRPTLEGQHDEEHISFVTEQAIVVQKQDPNVLATQLLGGLMPELVADVFAFTELSDVLNCAGLACRGLHNSVWRQPDFWVALGGPAFVDSLQVADRPTSIVPMIGSFRRWVFGLDGDWSLQVEQTGSYGHPADALRSVLGYVQALQKGDASLSDIWRLVRAAESAMQRADVQDGVLMKAASELVGICAKRGDIFGSIDIKDLHTAFAAMEKRAEQRKDADERNHWFFSDEADGNGQEADGNGQEAWQ